MSTTRIYGLPQATDLADDDTMVIDSETEGTTTLERDTLVEMISSEVEVDDLEDMQADAELDQSDSLTFKTAAETSFTKARSLAVANIGVDVEGTLESAKSSAASAQKKASRSPVIPFRVVVDDDFTDGVFTVGAADLTASKLLRCQNSTEKSVALPPNLWTSDGAEMRMLVRREGAKINFVNSDGSGSPVTPSITVVDNDVNIKNGQSFTFSPIADDIANDGATLTLTSVGSMPSGQGTLTQSGNNVTYQAPASGVGDWSVNYTTTSSTGATATGKITFHVTAVDPPSEPPNQPNDPATTTGPRVTRVRVGGVRKTASSTSTSYQAYWNLRSVTNGYIVIVTISSWLSAGSRSMSMTTSRGTFTLLADLSTADANAPSMHVWVARANSFDGGGLTATWLTGADLSVLVPLAFQVESIQFQWAAPISEYNWPALADMTYPPGNSNRAETDYDAPGSNTYSSLNLFIAAQAAVAGTPATKSSNMNILINRDTSGIPTGNDATDATNISYFAGSFRRAIGQAAAAWAQFLKSRAGQGIVLQIYEPSAADGGDGGDAVVTSQLASAGGRLSLVEAYQTALISAKPNGLNYVVEIGKVS